MKLLDWETEERIDSRLWNSVLIMTICLFFLLNHLFSNRMTYWKQIAEVRFDNDDLINVIEHGLKKKRYRIAGKQNEIAWLRNWRTYWKQQVAQLRLDNDDLIDILDVQMTSSRTLLVSNKNYQIILECIESQCRGELYGLYLHCNVMWLSACCALFHGHAKCCALMYHWILM